MSIHNHREMRAIFTCYLPVNIAMPSEVHM